MKNRKILASYVTEDGILQMKGDGLMYKMKEICEKTGLTERTIRYYIEEQLIQPIVEDGVHRKAYFFIEEHVQTLKDIAALRSAGFSITEVKEVLGNPAKISAIVGQKEMEYEQEIDKIKKAKEILGNLSLEEHEDVSKLADAIHQRTPYQRETPSGTSSRKKWRRIYAILFPIVILIQYALLGMYGVIWLSMLFAGILGIWSIFMAIGYFMYHFHYKKMKQYGIGKIVAIIDGNRNGTMIETYLGERKWSKIVTFFSLGIVHWNWVRPDCWFPIIQFECRSNEVACIHEQVANADCECPLYTTDGLVHTTTFRYGSLKKHWKIGDEIQIAWNNGEERNIYPYKSPLFMKKGAIYLLIGIICFVLSASYYIPAISRTYSLLKSIIASQKYEQYEQSSEPRELTKEEVEKLMEEIDMLEPIVYRETDFNTSELTNAEAMKLLYPLRQKNPIKWNDWIAISGSYFNDLAFALLGERYEYEDLMCECGKAFVTYNDKRQMYELCEEHTCTYTKRQYDIHNIYQESYYDGTYYRISVYQLFSDIMETEDGNMRSYYASYEDMVKKENCLFMASSEQEIKEHWENMDSARTYLYEYVFKHHEKRLDFVSVPEIEHYLIYYGKRNE